MKKKILAKYIVNSMVATFAGILGYSLYINSSAYKNNFHFINKMQSIPDDLQIINLGSTAAYYAFDYKHLNVQAMNMATYTQTFQYDLKILKKYAEKIDENAVVLISIVYFVFLCPHVPAWRKEVYNQFSKILGSEDKTFKETLIGFFNRNSPFFLRKYHQSILNMVNLEKDYGRNNDFTIYEQNRIINQKLNGLTRGEGISKEDLFFSKLTSEMEKKITESVHYLNELVDFCLYKGWKPVFIVLPYSSEMNKRFNKQLLDKICFSHLNEFVEKGIPVFNYSNDVRFGSSKLYMDMEYLNEKGRARFTNIVIEDLKKNRIF